MIYFFKNFITALAHAIEHSFFLEVCFIYI